MFLYRVEYTESESDIQNSDLLYKIDHQCQNTFDFLKCSKQFKKKTKFVFQYLYKFNNSYFVIFVISGFGGSWDFYIFIYILYIHVPSYCRTVVLASSGCLCFRRRSEGFGSAAEGFAEGFA